MKFSIARDDARNAITFSGDVSLHELAELRLDNLDKALLNDVGGDKESTAADYLLVLEMLFRRHAERQAANNHPPTNPSDNAGGKP